MYWLEVAEGRQVRPGRRPGPRSRWLGLQCTWWSEPGRQGELSRRFPGPVHWHLEILSWQSLTCSRHPSHRTGRSRAGERLIEGADTGHWRGGSALIKPGNVIFQCGGHLTMAGDGIRIIVYHTNYVSLWENLDSTMKTCWYLHDGVGDMRDCWQTVLYWSVSINIYTMMGTLWWDSIDNEGNGYCNQCQPTATWE